MSSKTPEKFAAPTPTALELQTELQSKFPQQLIDQLQLKITDIAKIAEQTGTAALDNDLWGGGGAAFLWEDLLSLEDATSAASGVLDYLNPVAQAEFLLKLVRFWAKLRNVRVKLDKERYQIMKAVKRKPQTVQELAKTLGVEVMQLTATVDALTKTKYRDDIMLLEEKQGILSTRF
jgi:hypothetical protein